MSYDYDKFIELSDKAARLKLAGKLLPTILNKEYDTLLKLSADQKRLKEHMERMCTVAVTLAELLAIEAKRDR